MTALLKASRVSQRKVDKSLRQSALNLMELDLKTFNAEAQRGV